MFFFFGTEDELFRLRICVNDGRECANHLSIISSREFASIASHRALAFLEQQKSSVSAVSK